MTAKVSWFHEYGFVGGEDFEEAMAAVEALGFSWVYGGGNADPEWPGWPAYADTLRAALEFYADERTWTQPTSWGGRIIDDEGPWVSDTGRRARAALQAAATDTTPEPDRVEAT